MAEFSGSLPDERFLFVNRITPFQKRVFDKIRLPEKIKLFRPFHDQDNNVAFRFPVQNTVVLKGGITQDGKPV
jgi:hypothetical protein